MSDFIGSVTRHLEDLRLRTYEGVAGRKAQLAHFATVVSWLDPVIRGYFDQGNSALLNGTGVVSSSDGVILADSGTHWAWWSMTWPELEQAGLPAARIGTTFFPKWQHPHIHGAFQGAEIPAPEAACQNVWPLQVLTETDIDERRGVIEALIETELHAAVCGSAFALLLNGGDGNDAWRTFPGYRDAVGVPDQ